MQGKILRVEWLINVHINESRNNYAGEPVFYTALWSSCAAVSSSRCLFPVYQRQWRQKSDLLKKKIVELGRDMNNTEISKCAAQHRRCSASTGFVLISFCSPARDILNLQTEVLKIESLMNKERKINTLRITGETLQPHPICKCTELKGPICCPR